MHDERGDVMGYLLFGLVSFLLGAGIADSQEQTSLRKRIRKKATWGDKSKDAVPERCANAVRQLDDLTITSNTLRAYRANSSDPIIHRTVDAMLSQLLDPNEADDETID
jgi:hypothetical protein